jgi:hypothetical protein
MHIGRDVIAAVFATVTLAAVPVPAAPGTVKFDVVEYTDDGRELPATTTVIEQRDEGPRMGRYRTLRLSDEVAIQVACPPAGANAGFAMVLNGGFSWEWFDRSRGDVFTKRQERGTVKVITAKRNGRHELVEVEFLSDVSLRVFHFAKERGQKDQLFRRVDIRKGSVFTFGE